VRPWAHDSLCRRYFRSGMLGQISIALGDQLLDSCPLVGPCHRRLLRVALEHFGRDRLAPLVTQQPDNYLFLALVAIARITVCPERVLLTLQIAARHIVEKQLGPLIAPPLGKQPPLDRCLPLAQPLEILIEVVLIKPTAHTQHVARRVQLRQTDRRQTRPLIDDPHHATTYIKSGR